MILGLGESLWEGGPMVCSGVSFSRWTQQRAMSVRPAHSSPKGMESCPDRSLIRLPGWSTSLWGLILAVLPAIMVAARHVAAFTNFRRTSFQAGGLKLQWVWVARPVDSRFTSERLIIPATHPLIQQVLCTFSDKVQSLPIFSTYTYPVCPF